MERGDPSSHLSLRRMLRLARPLFFLLIAATLAMLIGFWLGRSRPLPPQPNRIQVTVLNVGQGEAAVIRTGGGRFIVIGAGPPGQGKAVNAFLHEVGAEKIALLILPYGYAEAIGGAPEILDVFPVQQVLDAGGPRVNQWQDVVTRKLAAKRIPITIGRAGRTLKIDGVKIEVEAPAEPLVNASPANPNNSLVLRIVWGDTHFLFAGGVEAKGEMALLSRTPDLSAEWLRVARFGTREATSSEFLRLVSPSTAVISVGSNREGYPHMETLTRLEATGARLYRTDESDSPLTFISDGVQITGP